MFHKNLKLIITALLVGAAVWQFIESSNRKWYNVYTSGIYLCISIFQK